MQFPFTETVMLRSLYDIRRISETFLIFSKISKQYRCICLKFLQYTLAVQNSQQTMDNVNVKQTYPCRFSTNFRFILPLISQGNIWSINTWCPHT